LKNKRRERRNSSRDTGDDGDVTKTKTLDNHKENDNPLSSLSSILSFWQQQYSPMKWSEMYNEYVTYAKRMAQINDEFVKRSRRMTELYMELSEHSQRMSELYKESIGITETAYKKWLNNYYSFWGKNHLSSPTLEQQREDKEETTRGNERADLTKEDQKNIKNIFKDSLTFD
jgi:hypothetical protein